MAMSLEAPLGAKAPSALVTIGPADAVESLGWLRLMAIRLIALLLVCVIAQGSLRADGKQSAKGQAQRALNEQRFPWYDGKKKELTPLFPSRTENKDSYSPPKEAGEPLEFGKIVSILLWVLLAAVIVAGIFVLIRFGQTLFDNAPAITNTEAAPEIESARLEALPEKVRGKGDLLERARELAKAGAFSEAIAFLHGWQLIQLDKHGKIELQKGKTNRQYQGELAAALPGTATQGSASADLRSTFQNSTRLFEDAFYGHLPISGDEFQSVWSKIALFEKALPREKAGKSDISPKGEKTGRPIQGGKRAARKGPPP